mmetsp:Transcript_75135/g.176248  ORF Transcript_75135/g.176248 Transcript_75135/m.176248 type:complete len:298 (+) Transcript_75135:135-1028(+)
MLPHPQESDDGGSLMTLWQLLIVSLHPFSLHKLFHTVAELLPGLILQLFPQLRSHLHSVRQEALHLVDHQPNTSVLRPACWQLRGSRINTACATHGICSRSGRSLKGSKTRLKVSAFHGLSAHRASALGIPQPSILHCCQLVAGGFREATRSRRLVLGSLCHSKGLLLNFLAQLLLLLLMQGPSGLTLLPLILPRTIQLGIYALAIQFGLLHEKLLLSLALRTLRLVKQLLDLGIPFEGELQAMLLPPSVVFLLGFLELDPCLRHHGLLLHPALLGFFRRGAELDLHVLGEVTPMVL